MRCRVAMRPRIASSRPPNSFRPQKLDPFAFDPTSCCLKQGVAKPSLPKRGRLGRRGRAMAAVLLLLGAGLCGGCVIRPNPPTAGAAGAPASPA